MKVFKFPSATLHSQQGIKTSKYRLSEKQNQYKNSNQTVDKKCSSLDFSYFHSKKMKELEKVYKANNSEKKIRHKSVNSSKSTNDLKGTAKPTPSNLYNPKKQYIHMEKKIFLKSEKKQKQKQKYFTGELRYCLEFLLEKLTRCLQVKSQKIFIQKYVDSLKFQEQLDYKQNGEYSLVTNLLQTLQKCEQKKEEKKVQGLNERIASLEKEITCHSMQIKKTKLKQGILNEEIKKLTDKNLQLSAQLRKLRERCCSNQGTQTNHYEKMAQLETNVSGELQTQFPKLIQQLRVLKERENQVNILLSQLTREGINLEKFYKKGLKYKQNNHQQNNQSKDESSEDSQFPVQSDLTNKQKSAKKGKLILKPKDDQCLADDSIIDEMDAFSFNYCDKQNQMQAYTPRNVYQRKKPLDEKLKKQLELNFDCLYEEGSEHNLDDSSEGFPTI